MPSTRYQNSFDILRLLFAFLVLFTHAYFITGIPDRDLLSRVSHGLYHYPHIAVPGFFIVSGYLVIQSLHRSSSVSHYLFKRFVRIYPGLLIMLSLTILLGWIFYCGTLRAYFANSDIYIYFIKNLLMLHQYVVTGFFEGSPASDIINVSIWSIPYEVVFYLLLALFFLVPRKKQLSVAFGCYGFLLINLILTHYGLGIPDGTFQNISVLNMWQYGSFFFGGVVLGLIPDVIRAHHNMLLLIASGLLVLLFGLGLPSYFLNILLPVAVVCTGLFTPPAIIKRILKKTGDPSYGIYIYGFPVQQAIYFFFKPGYWQLSGLSVVVLSLVGVLSWKLIEKPALLFFDRKRAAESTEKM